MTTDFGDLRSLLHQPNKDHTWGKAIWTLIQKTFDTEPDTYLSSWLSYLCEAPEAIWQHMPINAYTPETLNRVGAIAPFAHLNVTWRHTNLTTLLETSALRQIKHLRLISCTHSDETLRHLATSCPNIQTLTVEYSVLTTAHIEALFFTQNLPQLTDLNFRANGLNAHAMGALARQRTLHWRVDHPQLP